MDENGQKRPKMAENQRKWAKKLEKTGQKWEKTGRKWPKMAKHDQLETKRTLDLPAGGIFGRRHPLLCSIFPQSRVKGSK